MQRTTRRKIVDFLTFPFRAFALLHHDRWGLSSLRAERFDYVAREVEGYCLDVGCGPHNLFVRDYLAGRGRGIDVFAYPGLTEEHLVDDMTRLPFDNGSFDTVTLIACFNHCPRGQRDRELTELRRVVRPGGKIVITMGNPLAELAAHLVAHVYDKVFKTSYDLDSQRGMEEGEEYFLTDREIRARLAQSGFGDIRKKYFLTQWGLNHLFTARARPAPVA